MSKKKHILVVSQYFYPEPFRINDICSEWVKRGYQVTVLTGIPNYPQGKYYEGYDLAHKRTEEWNGVKIVWYAKKHKIPHYLYVQDLWPDNVEIVTGIHSPLVLKPIGKMVDYIYEHCDHIFATSPSFVKEIQKRCRDKNKVSYWPQYAEEFYCPVEKKYTPEIPDDEMFKIIFTGNIGQAQGLEILPICNCR